MFTLHVIASFVVGGLLIALQTILGEHVPPRWRGTALTIPTTLAMGLFFIGLSKSPADVPQAGLIIPAALGADYLFVAGFAYFSRFGLARGLVGGYMLWGAAAAFLLHFTPSSLLVSILVYFVPFLIISYLSTKALVAQPAFRAVPFQWKHLVIRSLIGGTVIAGTVILAKTLGNGWGGLFSAFPAAFSAMFLIYCLTYGVSVAPSVALSVFFPGSIGFVLYLIVATWAFPRYGIWVGTLISYAFSVPFYFVFVYVKDRKALAQNKKVG